MSALVDRRTEISIDGCASRINDLQIEIAKLEAKIDALTMALDESRPRRGFDL
jgi:outer membrane murein-binding lipoprotein Lpp